jgi:hypothetical protein
LTSAEPCGVGGDGNALSASDVILDDQDHAATGPQRGQGLAIHLLHRLPVVIAAQVTELGRVSAVVHHIGGSHAGGAVVIGA